MGRGGTWWDLVVGLVGGTWWDLMVGLGDCLDLGLGGTWPWFRLGPSLGGMLVVRRERVRRDFSVGLFQDAGRLFEMGPGGCCTAEQRSTRRSF